VISREELEQLLRDIESDRIERTISTNDNDKFAKAITAFANDLRGNNKPGYLLIGVGNDGAPSGLLVTDALLLNLAALRSDGNIQPLPAINVAKFDLQTGQVAVVEVLPSDLPPVRYKGQVWIRIGPRRGIANEQEERLLTEKRIAHARTFDALPCLQSSLSDLSLELFRLNYLGQAIAPEILEANHRDAGDQLASLRFFDSRRKNPTNAGILLFGKNPLEWMPGAFIQFVRFDGNSLGGDVISERNLSGDMLTLLREVESLIEIQSQQRPIQDSLLKERMSFDYPGEALRELLMNAVLHRSYESTAPIRFYWFADRIEIQSPGALYGEASPENFPNQNSYRNPILAEALKTLGFVNRFGRGVVRANAALVKNGNRPAEFHFDHGFVRVTLWRNI
jgi:ATP-dependent DNA helicase RecG